MQQLFGIILTQALLWYVLYFGGTSLYADYFVMAINIVVMLLSFTIISSLLKVRDIDFIMNAVRGGIEEPRRPIAINAGIIHGVVGFVLMMHADWMFGAVAWASLAMGLSVAHSRMKRLLQPNNVAAAKAAITLSNEHINNIAANKKIAELLEQIKQANKKDNNEEDQ